MDIQDQATLFWAYMSQATVFWTNRIKPQYLGHTGSIHSILDKQVQSTVFWTYRITRQYFGHTGSSHSILDKQDQATVSWTYRIKPQYFGHTGSRHSTLDIQDQATEFWTYKRQWGRHVTHGLGLWSVYFKVTVFESRKMRTRHAGSALAVWNCECRN